LALAPSRGRAGSHSGEMRVRRTTEVDDCGFSMIEMAIVLALAALIAMLAVPSYQRHMVRGHRLNAAVALYRAAQFIEASPTPLLAALPDGWNRAPGYGKPVYRITLTWPEGRRGGAYVLAAQPLDSGPMRDDGCGTLVLYADGRRENRGKNMPEAQSSECWPSH